MMQSGMRAAQTAVILLLSTAAVQAGWGDRLPPAPDNPVGAAQPSSKPAKDDGKDADAGGGFSVFDSPKRKTTAKAVASTDKDRDKKDSAEKQESPAKKIATERPPNIVDEAAAEREREMQALLRRQMVCLKLMRVAMDAGDDDLLKKAEALDERAREIYARRTAHLPGSRQANFDSDESTLERHLGPTNRPTRGHSELLPRDRDIIQAQAREDRP